LLIPTNPPKYDVYGELLLDSYDRPESCLPESRFGKPYDPGHHSPEGLSTFEYNAKLPYFEQQDIFDITCQGRPVVLVIDATITGGFFLSDKIWTTCQKYCFGVSASLEVKGQALESLVTDVFQVSKDNSNEMPIVAFGLRLSAERYNDNPLELIQHTDEGNDNSLLYRMPSSIFLHELQTNSVSASLNTATWNRVHIVQETLQKWERRPFQQHFHLVVELLANIGGDENEPDWLCISRTRTHPLIFVPRLPAKFVGPDDNSIVLTNEAMNNLAQLVTCSYKESDERAVAPVNCGWQCTGEQFLWNTPADTALSVTERGTLGRGRTGEVEEVVVPGFGIALARKRIFIPRIKVSGTLEKMEIRSEIENLRSLDHKHIVKAMGCYQEPCGRNSAYFYVLLFPAGENDLQIFLQETCKSATGADRTTFSSWIESWFICLTSALAYIHYQGIHHEDIKPANIIHRGSIIYFTDFSSSRRIRSWEQTSTDSPAAVTRLFAAPEALYEGSKRLRHGSKTDVYSLGLVFIEMLTVMAGEDIDDLRRFVFRDEEVKQQYHCVEKEITEWFTRIKLSRAVLNDYIVTLVLDQMLKYERINRNTAQEMADLFSLRGRKHSIAGCGCHQIRWERKENASKDTGKQDVGADDQGEKEVNFVLC
jgi:hypothetical protein